MGAAQLAAIVVATLALVACGCDNEPDQPELPPFESNWHNLSSASGLEWARWGTSCEVPNTEAVEPLLDWDLTVADAKAALRASDLDYLVVHEDRPEWTEEKFEIDGWLGRRYFDNPWKASKPAPRLDLASGYDCADDPAAQEVLAALREQFGQEEDAQWSSSVTWLGEHGDERSARVTQGIDHRAGQWLARTVLVAPDRKLRQRVPHAELDFIRWGMGPRRTHSALTSAGICTSGYFRFRANPDAGCGCATGAPKSTVRTTPWP